jgi:hypothetical protein
LPAGGTRGSSSSGLFAGASPRAPLAATHGIFVRSRFQGMGRAVRAGDVVPGCHGFSPWQLRSRSSGRARWRVRDGPRWLSTPCALRLREPHLTTRSLTPLFPASGACCTDSFPCDPLRQRLSTPARFHPSRAPRCGARFRRAVPRDPRTPSVGSMPVASLEDCSSTLASGGNLQVADLAR